MHKIFQKVAISIFTLIILGICCYASDAMEETTPDNVRSQLHSSLTAKESEENKKAEEAECNAPYHEALPPLAIEESFSGPLLLEFSRPQELQQRKVSVTVIIDVFRAFTTACYVLEHHPTTYMLTTKSTVISRLASDLSAPVLIGKPEKGAVLNYNIPNSPTRVNEIKINGQNVLHRTEGGAKGVLDAKGADIILVAGIVNADATVQYITKLTNPQVNIVPMGHEATIPSLEDDICAQYINAQLKGEKMNLTEFHAALQEGPGKYFFSEDQWQYPCQDFQYCLEVGRFNFAIQAQVHDDYAILMRCDESS